MEVQVVEFCGEPGDVWFTDLRMLHTLSPNTTSVPRVVLTQRYIIEELGGLAACRTSACQRRSPTG
ncbi:MAG: hypothetical protein F4X98_18250 [Gammaproteobacteria bacterium]|nr:hypothetical protein [Gammaproteobacteria bacterium]